MAASPAFFHISPVPALTKLAPGLLADRDGALRVNPLVFANNCATAAPAAAAPEAAEANEAPSGLRVVLRRSISNEVGVYLRVVKCA